MTGRQNLALVWAAIKACFAHVFWSRTMTVKPICYVCTRNARTVDTPNVKVRVDSALVYRENTEDRHHLAMLSRCHGDTCYTAMPEHMTEDKIEALEVFRG